MGKNSVWLLEFDAPCADCNGVFSTKQKAIEALRSHKNRCEDIWLGFVMVYNKTNCALYRFIVNDNVINVTIGKYYIDEI